MTGMQIVQSRSARHRKERARRAELLEQDAADPLRQRQRSRKRALHQHHAQARIRHHVGQPLGRIVRVERQIGAAGLEHRQQSHHQFERALGADPDQHIGPDAETSQMMRQPVGVGVERRVAQHAVLEDHRRGIRRAPSLRGKQRRQRRRRAIGRIRIRQRMPGVVPEPQDGVALRRIEDRKAAQRAIRIGNRGRQQPNQALAQRHHRGFIEQVACVFQHAFDAGRLTVGGALLDQPDRQVELGAGGGDRLRPDREPGQLKAAAAAPASNASITWNSGCRDSDRAGLSTSTSRSNGSSAWP